MFMFIHIVSDRRCVYSLDYATLGSIHTRRQFGHCNYGTVACIAFLDISATARECLDNARWR